MLLANAYELRDYDAMANIGLERKKREKAIEQAKRDAAVAALSATVTMVRTTLTSVIRLMVSGEAPTKVQLKDINNVLAGLTGTELDEADGVWFTFDFESKEETGINPQCRLIKAVAKAKSKTGSPKVANGLPSTEVMIAQYGDQPYPDAGQDRSIAGAVTKLPVDLTFKQAYELSTNGNWRFTVRKKVAELYQAPTTGEAKTETPAKPVTPII